MIYTEVDEIVLDILGRDSPAVQGIPVTETWGDQQQGSMPKHCIGIGRQNFAAHFIAKLPCEYSRC